MNGERTKLLTDPAFWVIIVTLLSMTGVWSLTSDEISTAATLLTSLAGYVALLVERSRPAKLTAAVEFIKAKAAGKGAPAEPPTPPAPPAPRIRKG